MESRSLKWIRYTNAALVALAHSSQALLFPACQESRVCKTEKEIEVMRYICERSALAHMEVMKAVRSPNTNNVVSQRPH